MLKTIYTLTYGRKIKKHKEGSKRIWYFEIITEEIFVIKINNHLIFSIVTDQELNWKIMKIVQNQLGR